MAYTAELVNNLLEKLIKSIDISDEMYDKAIKEYELLGEWIKKENREYEVEIYSQGSFALGTVIKPISGEDDYDLDLVCELKKNYGLTAKELKCKIVKPWLEKYKTRTIDLEEKKRCWHVEYDEVSNFHMDVIPAYLLQDKSINITNHNEEENIYTYLKSNPKGYINWFHSRAEKRRQAIFEQYQLRNNLSLSDVEIEKIKRYRIKTPLQREIQLLKRHRDIAYIDNPKNKPISIIITTLSAQLYNNEEDIISSIDFFLNNVEKFIIKNKRNGQYYIENPSCVGENFADKWNEYPERAIEFFQWINKLKNDFNMEKIKTFNRVEMGSHIKKIAGEKSGTLLFLKEGANEITGIKKNEIKIDNNNGNLSNNGTVNINLSHHYGNN